MELSKQIIIWRLLLLDGLPQTFRLALISIGSAFSLGILLGVVRSKKWPVVQQVLSVYLGIVRGIPFLLLLLLVYFSTPIKGVFNVSVVTLTIYNSAYIAEIVRGGIIGLGENQFKAGKSLGMNSLEVIWYIVLPQVLYYTMPALLGQMVILVKGTATCSAIGYTEITRSGTIAMEAYGSPHIIYLEIMLVYFVMCHILTTIGKHFEAKGKLKMLGKR